jgi:C4-dicarboxylate transporter, DctQ subunit
MDKPVSVAATQAQAGKRSGPACGRTLGRVFDAVLTGFSVLAGVIVVLIMLSVSFDVVMRYFFKAPMIWVDELAEYAMLYIVFCGAAWLLRDKDGHVIVDIVGSRVSARTRIYLAIFASLVGIFVAIVLTYYSIKVTYSLFARGIYNPSLMEIPTGAVVIIIPIGMLLLLIQFIRNFLGRLRDLSEG